MHFADNVQHKGMISWCDDAGAAVQRWAPTMGDVASAAMARPRLMTTATANAAGGPHLAAPTPKQTHPRYLLPLPLAPPKEAPPPPPPPRGWLIR